MAIQTEMQVYAECDRCGENTASSTHTLSGYKQYLRNMYGWSFGKETLCPTCASEKRNNRTGKKGAGRDGRTEKPPHDITVQ